MKYEDYYNQVVQLLRDEKRIVPADFPDDTLEKLIGYSYYQVADNPYTCMLFVQNYTGLQVDRIPTKAEYQLDLIEEYNK